MFDMVLINAHAPTEDKDEEKKELFYAALEDAFDLSKGNVRLVLNDISAKIGHEECYKATVGKHSLHVNTNNNGIKLIDFALGKGMVVKSTVSMKSHI